MLYSRLVSEAGIGWKNYPIPGSVAPEDTFPTLIFLKCLRDTRH